MTGPPSLFALSLILTAAVLHSAWNAVIKGSADRALMMGLINMGHGALGLILIMMYLPPVAAAWPFIIGSTFIHFFYYAFLLRAYRTGDLSQVYPIARGIAPVLVAIGAQIFADEFLPPVAWAGILLVSFGISILFFGRRNGNANPQAVGAAVLTGFAIASYSVVDGLGVRASQSPLGYIGWLFLLECIPRAWFIFYRRCLWPGDICKKPHQPWHGLGHSRIQRHHRRADRRDLVQGAPLETAPAGRLCRCRRGDFTGTAGLNRLRKGSFHQGVICGTAAFAWLRFKKSQCQRIV